MSTSNQPMHRSHKDFFSFLLLDTIYVTWFFGFLLLIKFMYSVVLTEADSFSATFFFADVITVCSKHTDFPFFLQTAKRNNKSVLILASLWSEWMWNKKGKFVTQQCSSELVEYKVYWQRIMMLLSEFYLFMAII